MGARVQAAAPAATLVSARARARARRRAGGGGGDAAAAKKEVEAILKRHGISIRSCVVSSILFEEAWDHFKQAWDHSEEASIGVGLLRFGRVSSISNRRGIFRCEGRWFCSGGVVFARACDCSCMYLDQRERP